MAKRPREGWRLASGGMRKLFRHGVAGSDAAEHDALADIARALVHVAPDRTELASGVQVLNRVAIGVEDASFGVAHSGRAPAARPAAS